MNSALFCEGGDDDHDKHPERLRREDNGPHRRGKIGAGNLALQTAGAATPASFAKFRIRAEMLEMIGIQSGSGRARSSGG